MIIIEQRANKLDTVTLYQGGHDEGAAMCLLEAVAWVAGEPWSDHPECVCPVLGAFGRAWNDALDDETRQRLKPYIPRLVGTRSTLEVMQRRSWMACDWLVRTFTPAWLRLAGLDDDAAALEALPELTAAGLGHAAMPTIKNAKSNAAAAWDAAWAAAGAAAWVAKSNAAAAWDAAGAAAGAAAWVAAGDAAWDAAWAAARAAAWDAARDAARDALAPTVTALQESAFVLFDSMIEVGAA